MHEVAVCRTLLQMCEQLAREQGAASICCVEIELGALAPLDSEALRFAFEVMRQDTLAAAAALHITRVAAHGSCAHCGSSTLMTQRYSPCPHCGSAPLLLGDGDQLRLRRIEIVDGPAPPLLLQDGCGP